MEDNAAAVRYSMDGGFPHACLAGSATVSRGHTGRAVQCDSKHSGGNLVPLSEGLEQNGTGMQVEQESLRPDTHPAAATPAVGSGAGTGAHAEAS